MPHSIRLNRVWELRRVAEIPADPAAIDELVSGTELETRVDLPWVIDSGEYNPNTPLLLSRRFNRPSNLDAGQPIYLAIAPAVVGERVYFNGVVLETPLAVNDGEETQFFAIGERMQDNNRVDIVAAPASLAAASVHLIIGGELSN